MLNQEPEKTPDNETRFFYGYIVAVAAFFIMLVSFGVYHSFGVFFKPMLTQFGWSRALISGAFSLSSLMRGLSGIMMGGFTDRLGARTVLSICGFLIGLGYLLLSQINTIWHLYLIFVVLIGTGMSGVWVPLLSTVARWFTKRRSFMTGIVIAGLSVGTIIVSPVTNWLISIYDWRISYIITGSVLLVIIISAAQFLKSEPFQLRQLSLSKSESGGKELKPGADGFSLREAVTTSQFWLVGGILFCTGFWRTAILVHIVPHVTDLGFSAASAATILSIIGGVSILGTVIGGSTSDRLGSRQTYFISFTLVAVSLFWLLQSRQMWMLYLFTIIFSLGSGICGPLMPTLIARIFGLRSHGLIFGAINFNHTIGAALGPFVTGYLFDATGNYHVAFLVCAAISIVGIILATILRPIKNLGGRI